MDKPELTPLQYIRKRPGMYVGSLDIVGIKYIFQFFFQDIQVNSITPKNIVIEFKTDNRIAIEVCGIEGDIFMNMLKNLDNLETWKNFKMLGLPVFIALSEDINIILQAKDSTLLLNANKGIYTLTESIATNERTCMKFSLRIDKEIFKNYEYNYEILNQKIRQNAFLNPNFTITSINNYGLDKETHVFHYPKGIAHQLNYKMEEDLYANSIFRLDLQTTIDNYRYQISFSYQDDWLSQTYITSYANQDEMIWGGALVEGVLDGIIAAIKKIAKIHHYEIVINRKKAKELLKLIAAVKGNGFVFGNSSGTNLDMPTMRKSIKTYIFEEVFDFLEKNVEIQNEMLAKFKD